MAILSALFMAQGCASYDPEARTKQAGRPQQQYSAAGIVGMAFDQEASCQVALYRESEGAKSLYRVASAAHCYQKWAKEVGSFSQRRTIRVFMNHGFADLPQEFELQVVLTWIGQESALGPAEDLVLFEVRGVNFGLAAGVEQPEKHQRLFSQVVMPQMKEDQFGDFAMESGRSLLLIYYKQRSPGLPSLVAESPDASGGNNASVLFQSSVGTQKTLGHTFLSNPSVSGAGIYSCLKQIDSFTDCRLICIHSGTSRFMENSCTVLAPRSEEGI